MNQREKIKLTMTQRSKLSEFLDKHMGLYYSESTWKDFESKIPLIAKSLGYEDISTCIDSLLQTKVSNELITTLAHHLTIGETYFFREDGTLELIKNNILSPLIQERAKTSKSLRIWSAACCTGEEPYSIAMMLQNMIPNIQEWSIYILATDINLQFLQRAKEGIYRDWSFRKTSGETKHRYFKQVEDTYHIIKEIKDMVHFRYLNLVENNYPSIVNGTNNLDLILCNNVLIYFSENQVNKVITQLGCSLVEGGHLCVTNVEAPFVEVFNLSPAKNLAGNIFKKSPLPSPKPIEKKKLNNFLEQFLKSDIKKHTEKLTQKSDHVLQKNDLRKTTQMYFNSGDFHSLIEHLEKFFSKNISIAEHIHEAILLVRAYANLGELEKAQYWCERSIEEEKTNSVLYYLHAIILQEFSDLDRAIQELNKAIFLDCNFAIAYFTLGNIYLMKDKYVESKKNFRNVLLILEKYPQDGSIPEAEGLTAGRLREIVEDIDSKIAVEHGSF
ncbi:MAG: CheR family methyltransferase [Chlamydiota bacterium]|nr:CheR family methyltransferase [Chlamydiota bacterium]